MDQNIEAILLDIGNTLHILLDGASHRATREKITKLLGT